MRTLYFFAAKWFTFCSLEKVLNKKIAEQTVSALPVCEKMSNIAGQLILNDLIKLYLGKTDRVR